jgi:hypothetical protein
MPGRTTFPKFLLAASLAAPATLAALVGCSNDADTPDARTAEQAVGVQPRRDTTKSVEATRDVTVVKETKVIDNATGEVLKDTKEATPVKITQEKKVTTDVKVDVGKTAAPR